MFKGIYTAMITPFNRDGSIDKKTLKEFVDFQIDGGVAGLVPMGTTGESPTVSHKENIEVIEVVVEQTNGRVPVIAGTGSNCTSEAVDMTKRAKAIGADATLQVAPYYNKPSQEGFYRHFMEVAEKGGLPVIVYNIPGRSGKNVENPTMLKLADHEAIVGVKEASGSFPQIMDLINEKPKSFDVMSGDDNIGLPMMMLGGTGIVSVASNLIPAEMTKLASLCLEGEHQKALELHYKLLPLFKGMFLDTNPVPVKYALSLMGKIEETYRLPMCPMAEPQKAELKEILKKTNILSDVL